MSPATDTSPFFEHPIISTGKPEKFQRLTYEDIFVGVLRGHTEELRKQLLRNLKDAGGTPENIMGELAEFDEKWADPNLDDFRDLTATRIGKLKLVKYAYDQANPGVTGKIVLSATEILDLVNLLIAPLGYYYEWKTPEPEAAAPSPETPTVNIADPSQPVGYGTDGAPGAANPPIPTAYGK